jgi:RND superfamily putative drug exporter
MFARLGAFVSRQWLLVILAWLALLLVVQQFAPRWDDVTNDGDFEFLPAEMPSVVGQRLTEEAFPEFEAKSQIVLIVARNDATLGESDFRVADDLSKRFHNLLGVARYHAARRHQQHRDDREARDDFAGAARSELLVEQALRTAEASFDEVLRIDPQNGVAWHNRAILNEHLGLIADSERDRETAWRLAPDLQQSRHEMSPAVAAELPLVDVWTRDNDVFGSKLVSDDRQAVLIVVHLSNEFMATENIRVLETVHGELRAARCFADELAVGDLFVGISGSAAVGGDMLQSAAESIQNTELYSITLVIVILLLVYRSPLLVLVPLATIAVSLSVSMGLLAMLTQLDSLPGFGWWGFKVFKTTKIFVVVILFGTGTDFCLFLISRFREAVRSRHDRATAVQVALVGVGNALVASALTTILGLAMMFFADFGKFRSSGPAIGVCLAVTLAACLTFAPAMLRALGPNVFWPWNNESALKVQGERRAQAWRSLARVIVARPAPILFFSILALSPLAIVGLFAADHVTFDFLSELEPTRPSIRGHEVLERHFPIGESGPVIVLAHRTGAGFGSDEGSPQSLAAIQDLTQALLQVEGVEAVRSLAEPLGDPPRRISILSAVGRRKLFLREHQLTKSIFVAQAPGFQGDVTRFELVLDASPFSKDALEMLKRIDGRLRQERAEPDSFWSTASFAFTGTTAGIRDLKDVTRSDQSRIQLLVVCAVLAVLWLILRDLPISLFLIVSVVFSYLVTIGATELFFQWLYGATFHGLDWKVPVFLFVILVAVGEDYNIYLVTRVCEEQARLGPFAGIRAAVVKTGGIITSCGVIMAGTFVSMTSGSLRGIVELGFALSVGVMLDTFVVRTMLVPAFLSLLCRWRAVRQNQPSAISGQRSAADADS